MKIDGLNAEDEVNFDYNPKVKVKVKKSGGIFSKKIYEGYIESTGNWTVPIENFDVNTNGYDILFVKLNRKNSVNIGVYVDNFQIYDPCVTPENTCENPELFKPLFNIDIKQAIIDTTISGSDFIIKTVDVQNLKICNYATITITDMSGNTVHRVLYDGANPPDRMMWDGKDDAGNVMPDGWYKCKVVASNLCYANEEFTKKFKKESEIKVFDPVIEVNPDGGVTISGIYEASLAAVFIEHIPSDVTVFAGTVGMPEEQIGWNGNAGTDESQLTVPNFVESGQYRVILLLKSDCGYEEYQKIVFIDDILVAAMYINGIYDDPLYQWEPVVDKIVPPCDYYLIDDPFYRVPKNCCVGDLYLQNEYLWGDMTFNILGTIHIDESVEFAEGSVIIMNAGEGFHLTPDATSVNLGSDVHLNPSVVCEPCDCNKSMLSTEDSSEVQRNDISAIEQTSDSTQHYTDPKIWPNPASDIIMIEQVPTSKYSNYSIIDIRGTLVQQGRLNIPISLISVESLDPGEYIIRLYSETGQIFSKIIIY